MKKTKIVVPALAVLLLSTAASVSGTVAWFSMNNTVTVTGMTVNTKVSSNLLIAETNLDANYGSSIEQAIGATLEPASSIDSVGFYWTAGSNVAADGDAKTETYELYAEDADPAIANTTHAKKANYDKEFNDNYGFTSPSIGATAADDVICYAYVDYAFYLKATNSSNADKNINLTKLALKYNSQAVGSEDTAWRVGLMVQNAVANTEQSSALAAADVKSIFTLPGAANFDTAPKAIGSSGLAALNYGSSYSTYNRAGTVATLASGISAYYKVTVRLWLEGEDTNCTNETYAVLTNNWTLDLAFEFATETAAVTNIQRFGSVAVGATPDVGHTDAVQGKLNAGEENEENINLYQYTTTSGLIVWGNASTVASSTKFYSFSGTANDPATEIATDLAHLI